MKISAIGNEVQWYLYKNDLKYHLKSGIIMLCKNIHNVNIMKFIHKMELPEQGT